MNGSSPGSDWGEGFMQINYLHKILDPFFKINRHAPQMEHAD